MAGFLDTLFGGGAEKEAAEKNRGLYNNLQTLGSGYLQQGYDTGVENVNKALGSYSQLSDLAKKYGSGTDLYLNALGANGAAGSAAATDAFKNSTGYMTGLDAGLDAINRRRAASGMLSSGNADQDATNYATNLVNQQYGTWLNSLGGLVSPELSATSGAASGQAGSYNDLASLAQNNAVNKLGLLGQTTTGQVGANALQAQGEAAGAKNLLGLGTSIIGAVAGGGGGSLLSSLGGMGLGSGSTAMTTGRLY